MSPGVYMSVVPNFVDTKQTQGMLFDQNLELTAMPANIMLDLQVFQRVEVGPGGVYSNGPLSLRRASYTDDENKRNTITNADITRWLCKWAEIGNFADGFSMGGRKCNAPNSSDSFGVQCVQRVYSCGGFFTQYGNMHPRPALTLCSEYSNCGSPDIDIGSGKTDPNCRRTEIIKICF